MNFYSTWSNTRELKIDDYAFMNSFLMFSPISNDFFLDADIQDIEFAVNLLKEIPIENFIIGISKLNLDYKLDPTDIPCFSTFLNAANRVNELLEFAEEGLTFSELGLRLINASSLSARIKYGENHSKFAEMMSLVSISSNHPSVVRPTSLGQYLVGFSMDSKADILKKLLLRNKCIQLLIKGTFEGNADYRSTVSILSDSTAYRRRTNVKHAVEFALDYPNTNSILKQINWEM